MIQPVLLWTDALIWLLVAVLAGFALMARRREHLRAPWRRVVRDPLGMAALVVLLAYVCVGLLDSVHFRARLPSANGAGFYSIEALSVLDVLVTPLRLSSEKTYSAPLATHLYSKEAIEAPDGSVVRDYPRLRWGGAHLADASDAGRDISSRMTMATVEAAALWATLALALTVWLSYRGDVSIGAMAARIARGQADLPWRAMLAAVGVLIGLIVAGVNLGAHYHVLGTDKVGQDVLYQSLKSIRTGLVIGTLTTLIMLPFAVLLGTLAGYLGGWVDDLIQYLYTTLNSIPSVLLIAAAILILQVYMDGHPEMFETVAARADLRLLFLCAILGVTSWTTLSRLLRGESLKLRDADYVQAAVALGARRSRVLARHILPNVMHVVLITVVLDFSGLVLAEAVLSYVGVGVDPSMISWGNMINSARLELARDPVVWWTLAAAFALMFSLVLSANLFADAVREALDPRMAQYRPVRGEG